MKIAKLIEADGMETPATYNNLLNYNIYTTTWEISALWLP